METINITVIKHHGTDLTIVLDDMPLTVKNEKVTTEVCEKLFEYKYLSKDTQVCPGCGSPAFIYEFELPENQDIFNILRDFANVSSKEHRELHNKLPKTGISLN